MTRLGWVVYGPCPGPLSTVAQEGLRSRSTTNGQSLDTPPHSRYHHRIPKTEITPRYAYIQIANHPASHNVRSEAAARRVPDNVVEDIALSDHQYGHLSLPQALPNKTQGLRSWISAQQKKHEAMPVYWGECSAMCERASIINDVRGEPSNV